jgi:N-acetylglucosamine-6-phosphate deacetylase
VTDAVAPAGLDAGTFRIGAREARLGDDAAIRLPDGTLAGSALTMDQALRNIVEWGIADLPAAVRMASTTPARVLGEHDRLGAISPGYVADIVALTENLRVAKTWVAGRLVYDIDAT